MIKKSFISACLVIMAATSSYSQLKDIDGNTYRIAEYQSGSWMLENLAVKRLNNGTPIKMIKDEAEFIAAKVPAYSWYKNDPVLGKKYGALYNWYAVKTGKLCPAGWHVASDDDWMILEIWVLGMSDEAASEVGDRGTDQGLKLRHETAWNEKFNVEPSGFDALPSGMRGDDGTFMSGYENDRSIGKLGAYYWTSSEYENETAWMRWTEGYDKTIMRIPASYVRAHSVRCVKDVK